MNFFELLEWSNWKTLADEAKQQVFQQVLMYFVSPLKEVTNIELLDFELAGIKCRTFEFEIDGEAFILVPGNSEAILGWELGVQGLPTNAWDQHHPKEMPPKAAFLFDEYGLNTGEEWDEYINLHTSALRKKAIPPMVVQKYALPAGTKYIGILNTVTGEFTGNLEKFNPLEAKIRSHFMLPDSLEASLTWELPDHVLVANEYYLELAPETDNYYVFEHFDCTQESLRKAVQKDGYDLLKEDQWEYAVGAGGRKLFRWGNDLDNDDSYWGKALRYKMKNANMFGLLVDSQLQRYEITDEEILKLDQWEQVGIPLFDFLPLSTYYRSERRLDPQMKLAPQEFLYRRVISIELD